MARDALVREGIARAMLVGAAMGGMNTAAMLTGLLQLVNFAADAADQAACCDQCARRN